MEQPDPPAKVASNAMLGAWLPIETAPKDGTYILVSNAAGDGAWIAHWAPVAVSGYRFDQPWRSVMLNHYHIPPATRYLPPTHWMRLPAGARAAAGCGFPYCGGNSPECIGCGQQ